MKSLVTKYLYFLLGTTSSLLGIIGIFLPLMPTTCFLIVAVWAFSKSYPQLSQKILQHPRFGPPIQNWMKYKTISRNLKITISTSIFIGFSITFILTSPSLELSLVLLTTMTLLLIYINTRSECIGEKEKNELNLLDY